MPGPIDIERVQAEQARRARVIELFAETDPDLADAVQTGRVTEAEALRQLAVRAQATPVTSVSGGLVGFTAPVAPVGAHLGQGSGRLLIEDLGEMRTRLVVDRIGGGTRPATPRPAPAVVHPDDRPRLNRRLAELRGQHIPSRYERIAADWFDE